MTLAGAGGASEAEAREFARAFHALLAWLHATEGGARNEVASLVRDVLGAAGDEHSVVTRRLPPLEHVNLQTALDAWSTAGGRRVEIHGIAMPPHYGGIMLQQLVSGDGLPPLRLSGPGRGRPPERTRLVVGLPEVGAAAGHRRAEPIRRAGAGAQ